MVLFKTKHKDITIQNQLLMMTRLCTLLDAHYSLKEALIIMRFNTSHKKTIDHILQSLSNGHTLDSTLKRLSFHPQIVSHTYYGLLHGELASGIHQALELIKKKHQLKQQLVKTIRYPLVLISGFLLMLYFIQHYIYPNFLQLFSTGQSEPTVITLALFLVSKLFVILRFSLIFLLLLSIISFIVYRQTSVKQQMYLIRCMPRLLRICAYYNSVTFAMHYKSLLAAHFSAKEALGHLIDSNNNSYFSQSVSELADSLAGGSTLYNSLIQHDFFNEKLSYLFMTNEAHQLLTTSLNIFVKEAIDDTTFMIEKTLQYIQPIIFSLIAVSIVLIYLSLLLPMIDMMQTI